jgi:long-chain fatty acid transport protein
MRTSRILALVASTTLTLLASPVVAGGLGESPQGAKAAGMAGAFVAQADDPTALYYNVGGAALVEKKASVGITAATLNESLYQGLPPGRGAGTTGEQVTEFDLPPHIFLLKRLGESWVLGLGVYSPYRWSTEWAAPEQFAGRFVSTRSKLTSYDVNPSLSVKLSPNVGVGLGLIYRTSELSTGRQIARTNPFTNLDQEVAAFAVDSDMEAGYGWNAGWFQKLGERFSWGIAHRSAIETDYNGVGMLTQILTGNSQLDDLIAATLPLDQELAMTTRLELPAVTSVGASMRVTRGLLLEADVVLTRWSGIEEVAFDFPSNPDLDFAIRQDLQDTTALRFGVQYSTRTGSDFRLGLAQEESPQPSATVGPFLPDADRSVFAVGFGRDWFQLGFQWTTFDQRTVVDNVDRVNGSYRASAWALTLTATM